MVFRSDKNWLGGDGASSVDLGKGRVLWLFGDSFVASRPGAGRKDAAVVRNSLGIQQGYDPSLAAVRFYWGARPGGAPTAFFSNSGKEWLWPGDGERLGSGLIVFFMKIREAANALGFEARGWTAALIENPDAAPEKWRIRFLETPDNPFNILVGSGSVLLKDGFLYAFGAAESEEHEVYLARWPAERAGRGDLSDPEWWSGPEKGWVLQEGLIGRPRPVFSPSQNEFTVHWDQAAGKYFQIQTWGFGPSPLGRRVANSLTGPWSTPELFFTPREAGRSPQRLVYAGKAHPELRGADLVVTYLVNSLNFNELLTDQDIYFPKFLRVRFDNGATEGKTDRND
ncbi:MAG: DUF4185 domain-containing protein [Pseudomonadota bacterium]